MKKYIIYNKDIGEIIASGRCTEGCWQSKVAAAQQRGFSIMEGEGDGRTHKIVNEIIVPLSAEELPPPFPPSVCTIDPPVKIRKSELEKIYNRLAVLEAKKGE